MVASRCHAQSLLLRILIHVAWRLDQAVPRDDFSSRTASLCLKSSSTMSPSSSSRGEACRSTDRRYVWRRTADRPHVRWRV